MNKCVFLPRQLVRLTGLYFSGSLDFISVLGIIIIFDIFQSVGIPVSTYLLARGANTLLT